MSLTGSLYAPEPRVLLNGKIGDMTFTFVSMSVRDARELRDELIRILKEVDAGDQPS